MNRRFFLTAVAGLTVTAAHPAFAAGRRGSFSGMTGHIASGETMLTSSGVALIRNFEFDGAPDPRVGLGRDGTYDPATDMGPLRANSGAQDYIAPGGLDTDSYNEVYIWCREFNVPLAVAKVN